MARRARIAVYDSRREWACLHCCRAEFPVIDRLATFRWQYWVEMQARGNYAALSSAGLDVVLGVRQTRRGRQSVAFTTSTSPR